MEEPRETPSEDSVRPQGRAAIIRRRVVWIIAGIVLVPVAIGFTAPMLLRCSKKSDQVEAVNNARQMGLALHHFESNHGSFPSESTIAGLRAAHPESAVKLGTVTANDFFRQLIVDGEPEWEAFFYARAPWTRRPDKLADGANALKRGECAFSYIKGTTSSAATPDRPVAVFPLVKGQRKFDVRLCRKHYTGRAIILTADSYVRAYPVNNSGQVIVNGMDFFDPLQPFWHGIAPEVAWPEQ